MKQLQIPPSLHIGDLCIDVCQRCVAINDMSVELTCREFDVLYFLCLHKGWAITRKQILETIWEPNTETDYHAVETIIYRIRKKLRKSESVTIQTLIGYGYKLNVSD